MGSGALATFHEPTRDWFESSFAAPTRAQELAWPAIASGQSTLVLAPTGSGKTLAAFLYAIDELLYTEPQGCRVVYVSPLKALAIDVERNLRGPLVGIRHVAERMGTPLREPSVATFRPYSSSKWRIFVISALLSCITFLMPWPASIKRSE